MDGSISLSFDFLDKYVRFSRPEYLQIYLYIKYCFEKDGYVPSPEEISRAMDIPAARAEFVIEYWLSRGELINDGGCLTVAEGNISAATPQTTASYTQRLQHMRSTKPAYSQQEIEGVAAANKQISGMFYQAETILHKVLTQSETEMLFSFNDWLGLPVEVILMLLSYAAKKGKTTKRYLETVAIDWSEKGIDTFEAAEAYISELEAADEAEHKVRSILGIYDRGLTTTERKYIRIWVNEMRIPTELISLAYDKTVANTGKLSWSYMDKLLQSWVANGYATEADVKAAEEEFYRSKGIDKDKAAKKGKFNNYEPESRPDYDKLEEQILDMMLDED